MVVVVVIIIIIKTEWWGAGVVICLERGADLHMAQMMPLPLTVSCFSKIQTGFTFLVPAYRGSPGLLNGCVVNAIKYEHRKVVMLNVYDDSDCHKNKNSIHSKLSQTPGLAIEYRLLASEKQQCCCKQHRYANTHTLV